MPVQLVRRTARLRDASLGRGSRLVRRFSAFLPGANSAFNPSFETDLTNWTFDKAASRVAGGVDGAWCAQVATATSTGDFSSGFNTLRAANPTETWIARLWVADGTLVLVLRYWDAGFTTNTDTPMTATGATKNGFALYQAQAVAPSGAAFITIQGFNNHAGQTMRIDAAQFQQQ